jgi:hypothetical protein
MYSDPRGPSFAVHSWAPALSKIVAELPCPWWNFSPPPDGKMTEWRLLYEGLVRIQYKCLVPIRVFPEMKLRGLVISKTELVYNVLSPNFHIHISMRDLYIPSIGLPILLHVKYVKFFGFFCRTDDDRPWQSMRRASSLTTREEANRI